MLVNKEEYPAMYDAIDEAMNVNEWDYKNSEDFITYGLSDEQGFALNREIESSPKKVVDEFYTHLPW